MSRELANMINALIPGAFGLLVVLFPTSFAGKDATPKKIDMVKKIGAALFIISIVSVMFKLLSQRP